MSSMTPRDRLLALKREVEINSDFPREWLKKFDDIAATLPPTTDNGQGLRKLAMELEGVIADVEHSNDFDNVCLETIRRVSKALATHPPQQERVAVPEGWALVPRVPTDEMFDAGSKAACKEDLRWNDLNADEVFAAMLTAAPAAPATPESAEPVAWPMDSAPKDGTLIRLLVEFDENAIDDTEAGGPYWTVGENTADYTDCDEWEFAGWSWEQDCFTKGYGKPVGWLPFHAVAHPTPAASDGGLRDDAERYRWLRSQDVGEGTLDRLLYETISDDCNPPYRAMKHGASLDAAVDAARLATPPTEQAKPSEAKENPNAL